MSQALASSRPFHYYLSTNRVQFLQSDSMNFPGHGLRIILLTLFLVVHSLGEGFGERVS